MNDEQKLFWDNRPPAAMQALHDVMAERHRQMMVEGWTAKHDDEHAGGSMARAAAAYALAGSSDGRVVGDELTPSITERVWSSTGWAWKWWKPKDKRRNLIRAAALVLAEIERLDRAEARRWKPCARCTTPDYCTNQLRGCDIAESREAGIAPLDSAAGVQEGGQTVTVQTLRQHWLHAMECDHATGRDKPHCACSRVDLGWHPSVGAAVEAWLTHVSGVPAADDQTFRPSAADGGKTTP